MTLKIYGPAQTRSFRTLWMVRELGLDFTQEPGMDTQGTPSKGLLEANPMAQVPAIDDDGFKLSESMAINLYLARKHGLLAPTTLEDEAQTLRWSFWAMTAVEPGLLAALKSALGILGVTKDMDAAKAALAEMARPFNVLNMALDQRDYLLGGEFTVADLNVASVLSWTRLAGADLSDYPNVEAWLGRCLTRPAAVAAQGG